MFAYKAAADMLSEVGHLGEICLGRNSDIAGPVVVGRPFEEQMIRSGTFIVSEELLSVIDVDSKFQIERTRIDFSLKSLIGLSSRSFTFQLLKVKKGSSWLLE